MNKLWQLYRNEMTKLRRRSVWVILGLILLLVSLGVSLLIRASGATAAPFSRTREARIEEASRQIENLEDQLQHIDERIEEARDSPTAPEDLLADYGQLQAEIDYQNWFLDHLDTVEKNPEMESLVQGLFNRKASLHAYERRPEKWRTLLLTASHTASKTLFAPIAAWLEDGSYGALLDLLDELPALGNLWIDRETLDIERRLIEQDVPAASAMALGSRYRTLKDQLDAIASGDSVALPAAEEALEVELRQLDYRIDRALVPSLRLIDSDRLFRILTMFSSFLIGVLVIIVAGGSISSERSSGSIKSLILAPVRRWKIVTAKFLATLSLLLVFILLAWLVNWQLATAIVEEPLLPYVVGGSRGPVTAIPAPLYALALTAVSNVSSFFYMILAFMLSTVGLSTAAAVGISMGIRFGAAPLINLLLNLLKPATWMIFLPFAHLELSDRLFPLFGLSDSTGGMRFMLGGTTGGVPETSLLFSVLLTGFLCFLMLFAAYDSFLRRDL